jgi:hypothetical protein
LDAAAVADVPDAGAAARDEAASLLAAAAQRLKPKRAAGFVHETRT